MLTALQFLKRARSYCSLVNGCDFCDLDDGTRDCICKNGFLRSLTRYEDEDLETLVDAIEENTTEEDER